MSAVFKILVFVLFFFFGFLTWTWMTIGFNMSHWWWTWDRSQGHCSRCTPICWNCYRAAHQHCLPLPLGEGLVLCWTLKLKEEEYFAAIENEIDSLPPRRGQTYLDTFFWELKPFSKENVDASDCVKLVIWLKLFVFQVIQNNFYSIDPFPFSVTYHSIYISDDWGHAVCHLA